MNYKHKVGKLSLRLMLLLSLMIMTMTFSANTKAATGDEVMLEQGPVVDLICFVACKAVGGGTTDCIQFCTGYPTPH